MSQLEFVFVSIFEFVFVSIFEKYAMLRTNRDSQKKKFKKWNGTKLQLPMQSLRIKKAASICANSCQTFCICHSLNLYLSHDFYFNLFDNLYLYLAKRSCWSKKAASICANSCQGNGNKQIQRDEHNIYSYLW